TGSPGRSERLKGSIDGVLVTLVHQRRQEPRRTPAEFTSLSLTGPPVFPIIRPGVPDIRLLALVPLRISVTAVCGCLLAALAGGAFGAWRMATNIQATVVDWGRLRPSQDPAFGTVRWIDTHATIDLVAPDWRPLVVRFELAVPDGTPAPGPVLEVEADGWPIGELKPEPGTSTLYLPLRVAPARREKLQLRFLHEG